MPRRVATADPATLTALVDHVRHDLGLSTSAPLQRIDEAIVRLAVQHGSAASIDRTAATAPVSDEALRQLQAVRRNRALRAIGARSMATTVLDQLRRHGVEALVVKGIALAALTGRRAGERPGNDLDLLVRPHDLVAAHTALVSSGWLSSSDFPVLGDDSRTRYVLRVYNEADYRRDGAQIDLHWRLSPSHLPGLGPDDLFEQCIRLDVEGAEIPTVCAQHALAHVVAHGAKDAWRSFSTIVDLHLLLEHTDTTFDDITRHFPRSTAVDTARAAVRHLRSSDPTPAADDRAARRWWTSVSAVYDDRERMTWREAVAFRARWYRVCPSSRNAAIAACDLVLPPTALTWSRLPARLWPLAVPERLWRAASHRSHRRHATAGDHS